jgi:hypothetical protein
MEEPFKIGDEVRLITGRSSIHVDEVRFFSKGPRKSYMKSRWNSSNSAAAGWYIRYRYLSSTSYEYEGLWREAEDFILINEPEEEPMTKPNLYQTKKKPVRYGTFLTKNSLGQMVLEMKGENGACEGFAEDEIEIVTPFTVELTQVGVSLNGGSGNSIHLVSEKGAAKKDDVLLELSSGIIWRITKVDSKCLSPRSNKSKWMAISAEFIAFGEQ